LHFAFCILHFAFFIFHFSFVCCLFSILDSRFSALVRRLSFVFAILTLEFCYLSFVCRFLNFSIHFNSFIDVSYRSKFKFDIQHRSISFNLSQSLSMVLNVFQSTLICFSIFQHFVKIDQFSIFSFQFSIFNLHFWSFEIFQDLSRSFGSDVDCLHLKYDHKVIDDRWWMMDDGWWSMKYEVWNMKYEIWRMKYCRQTMGNRSKMAHVEPKGLRQPPGDRSSRWSQTISITERLFLVKYRTIHPLSILFPLLSGVPLRPFASKRESGQLHTRFVDFWFQPSRSIQVLLPIDLE
jgi:hypothetical protein